MDELLNRFGTVAWIIEPATADKSPYLTLKPEVAEKRRNAGDHVTPYITKRIDVGCGALHDTVNDEDEL